MRKKVSTQKTLKFPILNDVEYVSIYRTGKSVLEINGNDLEGMTWRQFQLYLGEKIPPGKCQFTMKFKDSSTLHTGAIRAARENDIYEPDKKEDSIMSEKILKEFSSLKDSLSKATNQGGITFDILLNATKQGYESQISFLNQQLQHKDSIIAKTEIEINQLENDLNDCEKESARSSGIGQYLAIGEKILSMKFGSGKAISLKESDSTDIPEQILKVLGVIDWQKIDAESINRISNNIQQYLSVIPKEFFKGQ
jgi:hypothetical protein